MQRDYAEIFRDEWLKRLKEEKIAKQLKLYIPAVLGSEQVVVAKARMDAAGFINAFLKNAKRELLLLGDSGSGKTLFGLWLVNNLWGHQNDYVPIHIHLPVLDLKENFLEEYFQIYYDLSPRDMEHIKRNMKILFIFDAYDEMKVEHKKKNIYYLARLYQWKAKVIIICRTEALNNFDVHEQVQAFQPFQDEHLSLGTGYQKTYLQPFDFETQVKSYIIQWKKHNKKLLKNDFDYSGVLRLIPDLANMVSNPFMLWIVMRSLPAVMEKYQKKSFIEKYSQTRLEIYDIFTVSWFERQYDKLKRNKQINAEWEKTILDDYRNYCTQLANLMWQNDLASVQYGVKQSEDDKRWEEFLGLDSKDKKWDAFFARDGYYNGDKNKPLDLIRHGALLKKDGYNTFSFLHNSLLEYFGAKHFFNSAIHKVTIRMSSPVNAKLIVNDIDKLRFAIDLLKVDAEFERVLWDIVEESKAEERVQIAAANAITILIAARKPCKKDMRRVRIRYANLQGGNFEGVDFSEADLRDVNFTNAWLCNAKLFGTCLDRILTGELQESDVSSGIGFGQLIFNLPAYSGVIFIEFTKDNQYYIVVTREKVFVYLIENHILLRTVKPFLSMQEYLWVAALASDANFMLLGTNNGRLIYIELTNGVVLSSWKDRNKKVLALAISNDGSWAFSGGADSDAINKWDCKSKEIIASWKVSFDSEDDYEFYDERSYAIENSVTKIIMSHANDWVLVFACRETVFKHAYKERHVSHVNVQKNFYDCANGDILPSKFNLNFSGKIILSQDDNFLIYSQYNGIRSVNVKTGEGRLKLAGKFGDIFAVTNNGRFVIVSSGHNLECWNCEASELSVVWRSHYDEITAVAVSHDNSHVISGDLSGALKRWDFLERSNVVDKIGCSKIIGISMSNDAARVIVFFEKSPDDNRRHSNVSVVMWNGHNGGKLASQDHRIDFQAKNILELTDDLGAKHLVHRVQDYKRIMYDYWISSPDGNISYFFSMHEISRFDAKTGENLDGWKSYNSWRTRDGSTFTAFSLSQDSKWAVTLELIAQMELLISRREKNHVDYKDLIRLWDCSTGKAVKLWEEDRGRDKVQWDSSIVVIALSPKGNWVAVAYKGPYLRFKQCHSRQERSFKMPDDVTLINWHSCNHSFLVIAFKDGSIGGWVFDENEMSLSLLWRSNPWKLCAYGSQMGGVHGLSESQQQLFLQREAAVTISSRVSEDQELDGEFKKGILAQRKAFQPYIYGQQFLSVNNIELSSRSWVVTLARQAEGNHVFLILESIERIRENEGDYTWFNHFYRIRRIDFFLEQRHRALPEGSRQPNRSDWFGQGLIEVADRSVQDIRTLLQSCKYQSSPITYEQGATLLRNIYHDQSQRLGYALPGAGNIYRMFRIREAIENHNCISWCEKHLQAIDVRLTNASLVDQFVNYPKNKI